MKAEATATNTATPIEEAKRSARVTIREAWPTAAETNETSAGMYEFDAIDVLDPESEVSAISIMHNEAANRFALVECLRDAPAVLRQAERELATADMLAKMELRVMMLVQHCETEDEIAPSQAAVAAAAAQSARLRLREIGGDVDRVKQKVDRFFLVNPA